MSVYEALSLMLMFGLSYPYCLLTIKNRLPESYQL
ncbi:putative holin-like toxin [Fictibacillus enclensis]